MENLIFLYRLIKVKFLPEKCYPILFHQLINLKNKKNNSSPHLTLLINHSCNNSSSSGTITGGNSGVTTTTSGAGKGTITCLIAGTLKNYSQYIQIADGKFDLKR